MLELRLVATNLLLLLLRGDSLGLLDLDSLSLLLTRLVLLWRERGERRR